MTTIKRFCRQLATAALFATCLTTAAHASSSQASHPDGGVYLRSLSFAGSGCPAGSLDGRSEGDGSSLALVFRALVAEAGPGISLADGRRNCTINVDLAHPDDWSYALASAEYKGYAALGSGTTATLETAAYFQGGQATGRLTTSLQGPYYDRYTVKERFHTADLVWSPCGADRSLNINTSVRVVADDEASGAIKLNGRDVPFGTFKLVWRRCN